LCCGLFSIAFGKIHPDGEDEMNPSVSWVTNGPSVKFNYETGSLQVFRGLPLVPVNVPSIMRQAGYEAGIKAASRIMIRESRWYSSLYKAEKDLLCPFPSCYLAISLACAMAGTEIRKLLK
jgi:hypothetical protein